MLDVVFNHTAEGNERGPTISFRGIDNRTYYMLTPEGYYFNFSGCGNTLNCNNPVVRNMVLDCLRYWAAEYHIDGFRFDLAAILGRDPWGAPLANPPLLESLAFDPILGRCKLIAEAWDAGGLYQVGSFPAYGRWAEWNGKYRDDVRRFLEGRHRPGRRARPASPGFAGPLRLERPRADRVDQLRHLPRRLHAARPVRLQRQAQRGQRRGEPGRRRTTITAGTAASKVRRTTPTCRRSGTGCVKNAWHCSWSARACR